MLDDSIRDHSSNSRAGIHSNESRHAVQLRSRAESSSQKRAFAKSRSPTTSREHLHKAKSQDFSWVTSCNFISGIFLSSLLPRKISYSPQIGKHQPENRPASPSKNGHTTLQLNQSPSQPEDMNSSVQLPGTPLKTSLGLKSMAL